MSIEFLELLLKEWKRMEEVGHASDLINNGQYSELDAIVNGIDYSQFYEYMESSKKKMQVSEIPAEYILVSAIYFSGNEEYADNDIMEDYQEYAGILYHYGEAGKKMGCALLNGEIINGFSSIQELIQVGEEYLNKEESDYEETNEEDDKSEE